jgi:hypothetical protein
MWASQCKQERHPVDAPDAALGRPEQARLPGLLRVQGPEVQVVREPRHRRHRRRRGLHLEGAVRMTAPQAVLISYMLPTQPHLPRLTDGAAGSESGSAVATGGRPQAEAHHLAAGAVWLLCCAVEQLT